MPHLINDKGSSFLVPDKEETSKQKEESVTPVLPSVAIVSSTGTILKYFAWCGVSFLKPLEICERENFC